MDTLVSIRLGVGNAKLNVRLLSAISRFDGVPDELNVALKKDEYIPLGSSSALATIEAREHVLDNAPTSEGDAIPIKDFLKTSEGLSQSLINGVIHELMEEDLLNRTGKSVKGNAYGYWK